MIVLLIIIRPHEEYEVYAVTFERGTYVAHVFKQGDNVAGVEVYENCNVSISRHGKAYEVRVKGADGRLIIAVHLTPYIITHTPDFLLLKSRSGIFKCDVWVYKPLIDVEEVFG